MNKQKSTPAKRIDTEINNTPNLTQLGWTVGRAAVTVRSKTIRKAALVTMLRNGMTVLINQVISTDSITDKAWKKLTTKQPDVLFQTTTL